MKRITAAIVLSVMFLSAGAGQRPLPLAGLDAAADSHVTTLFKTTAWPPAGQVSVDACNHGRCLAG